ncbi:MAG TPA: helix-turn-helix domain-containing protein [Ardenticatenaceae bacterium]|nr:helix-turn-helix domain-containing protein [Ardenticatenaceae bacterium]
MNGQFKRVADTLAQRTTELLSATVFVTDDRGYVVASSERNFVGVPFDSLSSTWEITPTRVPLHLDGQVGEVVIGEPLDGEVISPRLAQGLVELVIKQTAVVDRLAGQHELKNKFIHDLLLNDIVDEESILREAQILGMDLRPPRAVILVDARDYVMEPPRPSRRAEPFEAQVQRRSQLVIASVVGYFKLPTDTICAYIGDGEIAVLKASDTKNLKAWVENEEGGGELSSASWANLTALNRAAGGLLARLRRDTRAGISVSAGRYHPGLRGLARSYQDARAALSLGRRLHGQNGVHCLDALGIAAFVGLSDERTKIELARYLLSPLDQEPELLETLSVFFTEDCRPSSTSNRLSIHRNTLGYRLDKITALTGLDPRRYDDAVQIRLALVLRSLHN